METGYDRSQLAYDISRAWDSRNPAYEMEATQERLRKTLENGGRENDSTDEPVSEVRDWRGIALIALLLLACAVV